MSRPINSLNRSAVTQASSILQVITSQGTSTVTIAGGAATLNLDSLYVKNIYLLDTLHAKLNVDVNAPDKLIITKGVIANQINSTDPLNEVLSFNNVSFQPDVVDPNNVSIYTSNILTIGKIGSNLNLIGYDINVYSNDVISIYGNLIINNDLIVLGNINLGRLVADSISSKGNINGEGNLIIKDNSYFGGNIINISNDQSDSNVQINFLGIHNGRIEFDPKTELFNINQDTYINGNLQVNGNLTVINQIIQSNLTIYQNSNIIGNLEIEGNLLVFRETQIIGNLFINSNLFVSNANIKNDLTVQRNLYVNAIQSNTADIYTAFHTTNANIGNLSVDYNANIYCDLKAWSNLIVLGDSNIHGNIIVGNIILNNNTLSGSNNLKYNSTTLISVNENNVLNLSNIIIVDPSNSIDVMLEVRGNISCDNLFLTSAVEKKRNIREISKEEIVRLDRIKSYNFDLKSNNNNNYGFLAHEVHEIFPSLSTGESVNYIGFIPLLLEKIRKLEARIESIFN